MTNLTYDPPFEPVIPASQADSEVIRRAIEHYRRNGKEKHADYLQAILDDREGFEERGGPGSGHHGHEGRPGEVGGSVAGEGGASRRLGITSYREGKTFDEVERDLGVFSDRLNQISGVTDVKTAVAWGTYEDQREPTWLVEYKGNGEAMELTSQALKEADQDSGLIWADDLSNGIETTMAKLTIDLSSVKFSAGIRPAMEFVIEKYGQGATWQLDGRNLILETMAIPQFGGDSGIISDLVREATQELETMGVASSNTIRTTRILVAKREDDYAWR